MPDKFKEMAAWKNRKAPISYATFRSVVDVVFGERVVETKASGGSHQAKINVPELKGELSGFDFGFIRVCLDDGQNVGSFTLRECYKAAKALKLLEEEAEE